MRRLLRLHCGEDGADFVIRDRKTPPAIRQALDDYFAGDLTALDDVPVETTGASFQREVWAALRSIPPGTTLSYGALAQKLGRPKAVRAVGLANGANPIAIVVPCHRVIGADASLTGYGGGVDLSTRPEPASAPSSKTSIIEADCTPHSAIDPQPSSKPNSANSRPSVRTQLKPCPSNPVSQTKGAVQHPITVIPPPLKHGPGQREVERTQRGLAHPQVAASATSYHFEPRIS